MKSFDLNFVTFSLSPDNENPNWRQVDKSYIERWKLLSERSRRELYSLGGHVFSLAFDFDKCIALFEHHHQLAKRIYDDKDRAALDEFQRGPFQISATILGNDITEHYALSVLEYLIYEFFLVLNLSAPGSFNSSTSYIVNNPPKTNVYDAEIRHDVSLHAGVFESALLDQEKYPWLRVGFLDFDLVYSWLLEVVPRGQMIPRTPTAKSLFALLHLTKADFGPASVAWVFYALEALFDCRPGENFSRLVERVSLLLMFDQRQTAAFRKGLRPLYDMRSSFVHGGMQVVHPIRDDLFDDAIDDEYWTKALSIEFGTQVIIASLQNLIQRGWAYPLFEEHLHGSNLRGFE